MTANEAMKEALELLGIDNAVEEPLNEEERKEMSEKLRRFFLECAEHSDEILQIIDLSKILG